MNADSDIRDEPPQIAEALVADDDDFFRLAMASILRRRHGIATVHEVASFDAAAAVLADRPGVSFASFDLDMPGMGEVGQLLALRRAYSGLRVAIVSGTFDRNIALRALAAGVHGYIPKMGGAAQLGRAVGLVLAGEIYLPPAMADIGPPNAPGSSGPATPAAERKAVLTERQQQVLELIGRGATNKEIAARLGLGEGTVKIHVGGVLKALGVTNRSAAAASLRGDRPLASTEP